MATMGLRINQGGGGYGVDTSVADIFAKAMFGDPEREMKLALSRSDLQTDDYQRRQIQSVVDRNNALQALDQYKLEGMQGAEGPLAQILQARGGQPASAEAPVPVDATPIPVPTPRPDVVPAGAIPPEYVSPFLPRPAGPAMPMPPPLEGPVPIGETQPSMSPVITGRPDAPALAANVPAPVTIAGRPAGPEMPMPLPEMSLSDTRGIPEQPAIIEDPNAGGLPGETAMNRWGQQNMPWLFGGAQPYPSPFAGRPGGPQLPLPPPPAPPPEAPVPIEPTQLPTQYGTGIPGVPGDILPPEAQATGPITGRPGGPLPLPIAPPPEAPVPVESMLVPQPQPTAPEARPSTVPPPDVNAGIVQAGTGDMRPAGAAPDEAQVMPGPQPGTVTVHTPSGGRLDLSEADYNAIAKGILSKATGASDLSKGTGEMAGLIGTVGGDQSPAAQRQNAMLYTGNLPTRDTVVSAGDTAGTDQAIRVAQATEAAKPANLKERIQLAKGPDGVERPYQVGVDPVTGKVTMTAIDIGSIVGEENLVPDQPGTGEKIVWQNQMAEIEERVRRKLPISQAQADLYAAFREQLYGTKTSSTLTSTGDLQAQSVQQGLAHGVLTQEQLDAAVAGSPAVVPPVAAPALPPPVSTPATPPPVQAPPPQAPAAVPAPEAPAGPTAPATVIPDAAPGSLAAQYREKLSRDADGNIISKAHESIIDGIPIKNYDGWWGDGEKPQATTETATIPGGGKVTTVHQPTGKVSNPSATAMQNAKVLSEAIRGASELDNATPGKEPGRIAAIMNDLATRGAGKNVQEAANLFTNEDDRKYVRAIYAFINSQLRTDTGAAISAEEYAQYRSRFVQPSGQGWGDYDQTRLLRNDSMRAMRKSLVGQVDASQLRDIDTQMAKLGVDLDWQPPKGGSGGGGTVKKTYRANPGGGGFTEAQ